MTWATPLLAGVAAAIAIPALVILYFLKLRRRTVEVSTTLLWKKAIQDLQANAPFQKLRKNILLLLQLLVLAAALLALAQPRTTAQSQGGRRLVLMIDRSASMNSTDDTTLRTRLELAKERALEQVEQLRQGDLFGSGSGKADEAMVIAFDAGAEILSGFTSDRAALRDAIGSIAPTDGPSEMVDAFKLAQAQRPRKVVFDAAANGATTAIEAEGLVGGQALEFHLFSDGRVGGLDEVDPREDDAFEYHAVGSPTAGNIGLIGLRAERGYEDPTQVSIYVGLQSTDDRERSVEVELGIDGVGIAGIKTVVVPAATTPVAAAEGTRPTPAQTGVVFELTRPQGFLATIAVRTGDSVEGDVLRADNLGWVVVPPARRASVAVVTRGNLFITSALEGLPLARLDTMSPAEYDALVRDGRADRYDVVVLDGTLPAPMAAGAPAPGRYLIMGAVPEPPFGVLDKGETGPDAVLDWSRTHPVLRDVVLDGLRIGRGRAVEVPEGSSAVVLAQTPQSPAILELSSPEARAILVPFDVAQSNWPFDVGFVVFLASAVDYLSADSAAAAEQGGAQRQFVPGQVLTTRLPAGVENARLLAPEGAPSVDLAPAADGSVAYGPVRRAGVYRVRWEGRPGPTDVEDGGRASRVFAVNLLDPPESDVAAAETLPLASRVTEASARGPNTTVRELWPWLLVAALAVMVLEWWVYNRKVHV